MDTHDLFLRTHNILMPTKKNWNYDLHVRSRSTHADHDSVLSSIGMECTNARGKRPSHDRSLTTSQSQDRGPKRLYEYVNNWVPAILLTARCNNDGKLLNSGRDTVNVSYYVASYAAKNQQKTHNMLAILAEGYAYHIQHPKEQYVNCL